MNLGLDGKVVVITGAATGIGRATARAFAREELERTPAGAEGATATHVAVADLATEAGVNEGLGAVIEAAGGKVDVLFNNVGGGAVRTFDELDDAAWRRTLELNFFSQVRAIRHVLPLMRERGTGVIVNNSSDLARQPEPVPIDYAVSKAAVLSLTKALARSEGPAIRVTAVAPGPVWSEFWTKPGGFAETLGEFHDMDPKEAVEHEMSLRRLPLGRLGTPEEIANVVVFIASDAASYVTGTVWGVDGGSIRNLI